MPPFGSMRREEAFQHAADEDAVLEEEGKRSEDVEKPVEPDLRLGRDEFADIEADLDPKEIRKAIEAAEEAAGHAAGLLKEVVKQTGVGAYRSAIKSEQRLTPEGESYALQLQMAQDLSVLQKLMKRPSFRRLAGIAAILGWTAAAAPIAALYETHRQLGRQHSQHLEQQLEEEIKMGDRSRNVLQQELEAQRVRAQADTFNHEFALAEEVSHRVAEQVTSKLLRSGTLDRLLKTNNREGLEQEIDRLLDIERKKNLSILPSTDYWVSESLAEEARLRLAHHPEEAVRLYGMLGLNPLELANSMPAAKRQTLLPHALHRFLSEPHPMADVHAMTNSLIELEPLIPSLSVQDVRLLRTEILNSLHKTRELLVSFPDQIDPGTAHDRIEAGQAMLAKLQAYL